MGSRVDHHPRLKTNGRPLEEVPRGKGEKNRGSGVKENLKPSAYKQLKRECPNGGIRREESRVTRKGGKPVK